MKLVRLDWFSRIAGNRVEWFTNLELAHERVRSLLESEPYVGQAEAGWVEVPMSQSGLIAWLNEHLCSANI